MATSQRLAKLPLALTLLLAGALAQAQSAIDAHPFPNPQLQARYEALIVELRCPQCLNTNLAGSDAMIAQNLRREVHRLLLEGKTDAEVKRHLRDRYGDFILYRPRWTPGTALLWLGPFALLLVAALALARLIRGRKPPAKLSSSERTRLKALLARGKSSSPPAQDRQAARREAPLAQGWRAARREAPPAQGKQAARREAPPAQGGQAARREAPPAQGRQAVRREAPPAQSKRAARRAAPPAPGRQA